MKSMAHALTWEFLRHNSWLALFLIAIGNALPLFVLTAISGLKVDLNSKELVMLPAALIPFCVFLIALGVSLGQGPISRLYLKPISTSSLVASFFVIGAIFIAIGIVGSMALWNYCFNLRWPIAWPALFGVTFWAAVWPSTRVQMVSPLRLVEVFLIVILMFAWCFGMGHQNDTTRIRDWNSLGVFEYTVSIGIIAVGYWVSVRRATLDRCGRKDSWLVDTLQKLLQSWDARSSIPRSQFKSAWLAHLWYERSTTGLAYVVGVGVLLSFVAIVAVGALFFQGRDAIDLPEWGNTLAMMFIMHIYFAGLLGFLLPLLQVDVISEPVDGELSELARSRGGAMSEFRSALPIADVDLSKSVMVSIGVSLLCVFAMFAVLALGYFGLTRLFDLTVTVQQIARLPWVIAGGILGSWAAMANASMLAYLGRWRLNIVMFSGILTIPAVSPLSPVVVGGVILLAIILVSIGVFYAARKQAYLSKTSIFSCLVIAAIAGFLLWILRPQELPPFSVLYSTALSVLVVLPAAGMPLAIAASRRN
jgi:hypothetical protein